MRCDFARLPGDSGSAQSALHLYLHFVTQTDGEFTLTPESRTIASLCSMTVIHRVNEEAEKLAEWFGVSEREVAWVRTAKAGNDEDGYSEALLGVDEEGWFPDSRPGESVEAQVIDGYFAESRSEVEPDSEAVAENGLPIGEEVADD